MNSSDQRWLSFHLISLAATAHKNDMADLADLLCQAATLAAKRYSAGSESVPCTTPN